MLRKFLKLLKLPIFIDRYGKICLPGSEVYNISDGKVYIIKKGISELYGENNDGYISLHPSKNFIKNTL